MYVTHFSQRLSVPRSFVWWSALACGLVSVTALSLVAASAIFVVTQLGQLEVRLSSRLLEVTILTALAAFFVAFLVGIVLNGYLPSMLYPRPRNALTGVRALLRSSATSRLFLFCCLACVGAILSLLLFAHRAGPALFVFLSSGGLVLVVLVWVHFRKFALSAGRSPLYEGLSDSDLGTLFESRRFDDDPEWELVNSITSEARAEAYRQLARGRYLNLRILAALVGAGGAAAIPVAVGWALGQPLGFTAVVLLAPIALLATAQFMHVLSEQYDALAERYADRGKELRTAEDRSLVTKPPIFQRMKSLFSRRSAGIQ